MLIWFQATLAVLGVALCVMAATDITQRWHLLLAPFGNGSLIFMDNTTRQTIVADIDPRQSHPVEIALNSAGQNATQVVGPLVAGAIIGSAGIAGEDALRLTCTQPPW